jgi:hypothetical protein
MSFARRNASSISAPGVFCFIFTNARTMINRRDLLRVALMSLAHMGALKKPDVATFIRATLAGPMVSSSLRLYDQPT